MRIQFYSFRKIVFISTFLILICAGISFSQVSTAGTPNQNKSTLDSIITLKRFYNYGSNASFGIIIAGRTYSNNDSQTDILYGGAMDFNFTLNSILKRLYFSVGIKVFKYKVNDRDPSGYGGILSFYPSYNFYNTRDNKYSFWGGIGYHILSDNYFTSFLLISGSGAFTTLKAQYNLNEKIGLGLNFEIFKFTEATNSDPSKGYIFNNTFYLSAIF